MYEDLLMKALTELAAAAEKLREEPKPFVPLPRHKIFYFCDEVSWPYVYSSGEVGFYSVTIRGKDRSLLHAKKDIVSSISEITRNNPRKILRIIRRIQAATAWCLSRAEGRERAAQEMLRQQSNVIEKLEAEIALEKLSK